MSGRRFVDLDKRAHILLLDREGGRNTAYETPSAAANIDIYIALLGTYLVSYRNS